jgi:hypothetical protein
MTKPHLPAGNRPRLIRWTAPALMLAAAGCGFPHDRYGSDTMFGSFLRPIAPTPPIWTGQDPGMSPAYDGGARMGLPSPDVPARESSVFDRIYPMPTFNGNLGGAPRSGEPAGPSKPAPADGGRSSNSSPSGAHLIPWSPPVDRVSSTVVAPAPMSNTETVTVRPFDSHTLLTSGAAIEPAIRAPKPFSMAASMKDPRAVYSVDEGEAILQACGAKSMVMEPQPTGEMRFICTMNDGVELHRYEAKSAEAIDAVRAVMWQIKNAP